MKIGIDVGGSHIGIGAVDSNGQIQVEEEVYISDYDRNNITQFIENFIITTLKKWTEENHIIIDKIGIGVPGIVKDNEIKYCVNLGVSNYNLKAKIQEIFPNVEIQIKNDAKCAGLAEKKLGALKSFDDGVFICIGTGIGGAAFYNGELVVPKRSSGFEFGHMIFKKDGEPCMCGSKGCFEIYGSMRYFKNNIKSKLNLSGKVEGDELLSIVKKNSNNDVVKGIINEYIQNLCVGISNIIDVLEPQAICIGGGFVEYKEILLEKLKDELLGSKYIFYKENMPQILTAELGNDAGIIGSALFA